MPRNQPERELARECTKLLQLDGWRALPLEPISRREWGKGTGEIGQPDYLYLRYGLSAEQRSHAEVIFVEWKSPDGKVTAAQRLWHDVERERGALTAIAKVDFPATVDGFIGWYVKSGLCRRIDPERKSA
jgi:hypothetical protein